MINYSTSATVHPNFADKNNHCTTKASRGCDWLWARYLQTAAYTNRARAHAKIEQRQPRS